ncbi:MAG: saccharopine dehydrogenase C-terminal domain-containing protein [Candidatus Diapherotrites archaeon]
MHTFNKKILMIGYGAVSKCALPLLFKHIKVPFENVTVIDFADKSKELNHWISKGVKYHKQMVSRENLADILSQHLEKGGLCIDLAWNIACWDIVQWCHDNEVLYVNTSVEQWDPKEGVFNASPYEKSLYFRQMKMRELCKNWKNATTFVVDHGANPGLISHFAKQGAIDIARKLIKEKKAKNPSLLEKLIKEEKFGELAMHLGIKVIHCSERDTQITNKPKEVNEFVGTWSIEGLREEGTAPAEMGWGTHEKEFPALAYHPPVGPKNQIFLAQMGINTWVHSWVPDYEIVGMVIRHGEAFGLSDSWTVWKNGKAIYRPTVHYAYMPCDETISSLHELRCRNYEMQPKLRILDDKEITSGADILGALLMGHEFNSWWAGSILTIEESRKLAPGQNATTIQVAISVIAAAMWAIENPRKGFCLPDDLPHEFVLKISKPYLGEFVSKPSDWTPLGNRKVYFKENPASKPDKKDVWQFKNFLFTP